MKAIEGAISDFVMLKGRGPVVVDIGCGTGLLALMAARAGASHVYACEQFEPLAKIAQRVVQVNEMEACITVHMKCSSDLQVGEGLDLPCKADMVVSEILDSCLLGEGVSFPHQVAMVCEIPILSQHHLIMGRCSQRCGMHSRGSSYLMGL